MKRTTPILALALFLAPAALVAQKPAPAAKAEESEAQLMKEAKISEAVARATALRAVPGGVVKKRELEREDGKLIWSFDIAVAGKSGIEEVHIDAKTGVMVGKEHETPAEEKAEAAEDAEEAEESEAELMKGAKISEAVARATALRAVPGGVVKKRELENENGKLIWSFDIAVAGKRGIQEVHIDAKTGVMLSNEHETPADEKKEAAEDAAKVKAKASAGMKKPY
ncbi:MAG: PepSY domain-containing protein [Gemmatimonadales bacterium]